MTDDVPSSHPRAASLERRERLEAGLDAGIVARQGLIAHGRGEAFDYLLGERTIASAARAARVAAAHLLDASHPVVSVNGNTAALAPDALVDVADATGARLEVNLYHRTDERLATIADHLRDHGATDVGGLAGDAAIPGLDHDRALVDADGIAAADVVVVPLEDGDRAQALAALDKTVVAVDLNPLSRTARAADVPIVDEVTRALPNVAAHARALDAAEAPLETDDAVSDSASSDDAGKTQRRRALRASFDPDATRAAAERAIRGGAPEGHTDGDHC